MLMDYTHFLCIVFWSQYAAAVVFNLMLFLISSFSSFIFFFYFLLLFSSFLLFFYHQLNFSPSPWISKWTFPIFSLFLHCNDSSLQFWISLRRPGEFCKQNNHNRFKIFAVLLFSRRTNLLDSSRSLE